MRSRLLSLSILATLAPSLPTGRTGAPSRGPFGRTLVHRPVRNAEGASGTTSGTGAQGTTGSTGAADKGAQGDTSTRDEPLIPQSKVNEIAAKERRAAEAKLSAAQKQADELAAKVAAFEEEKRQAEEAKLSAAARADLERKREREGFEKRIAELDAAAKRERSQRHDALRSQKAASLAGSIAQKLYAPAALPFVEQTIASRLVVETGDDGTERVVLRMGAPGDHEPVETGWQKLLDTEIAPAFFKVEQGAGARHGQGASQGSKSAWQHLDPTDKIAFGMNTKK